MRKILFLAAVLLLLSSGFTAAQPGKEIARGKYLVEQVAMCVDCHSPRNERGEFIKEKWLQGSTLDFQPIHPMPVWAGVAPIIAGLGGWKEADLIKLLQTGLGPDGNPLRPPMPPYKMNAADARAVVAYLKSLKPKK